MRRGDGGAAISLELPLNRLLAAVAAATAATAAAVAMGLAASLPLVALSLTPQLKLERMQKMLVACGTLLDNWEIARGLKSCRFDEISGAAAAGHHHCTAAA